MVENDVDYDTSCPIRDIEVCHDVTCHHDLHPDRELNCLW